MRDILQNDSQAFRKCANQKKMGIVCLKSRVVTIKCNMAYSLKLGFRKIKDNIGILGET